MTSYTDVFGGSTVQAADVQFRAVALSASIVTVWPAFATTGNECARIMKVTPSAGSLTVTLPDATLTSAGMDVLFDNPSATTFTVLDSAGGVVATVAGGEVKYFYLSDSSTAAGTWRVTLFGVGASSVDAGQLAGYGLKALTSTLNFAPVVTQVSSNTVVSLSDRAKVFVWVGGSGTLTLPTTAGSTSDFSVEVHNQGTGTLTVATTGGVLVDGSATITLVVNESCFIHMGSTDWYTVGRGRNTQFNFTQLNKVVTGGTVNLTLTEASNVVQTFTGTLLSNQTVNQPAVVQVYYVNNSTSGAYTMTFGCVAGGTTVAVVQGQAAILFCDGTNIINANTSLSGGISSIVFAAGSAAVPSASFATSDTGFYSSGTDEIGVANNGVYAGKFTTGGYRAEVAGAAAVQAVSSGAAASLVADRPAGSVGSVRLRTGGTDRWSIEETATAESGANAGSNLALNAYSDAGALLGTVLTAGRSTQVATFTQPPVLSGASITGVPISTGVSGLGANVATFLATPSSANLAAALTDETGTGANVFATSPTLVTPALGTPSSGTLTSCTGLPVATGVSGLGTGVATTLAVNVGTAGAPVVNGGVLGTPSSGTVTNLTGTASININGTVGATTPAAGTFTTLVGTGSTALGDAEASDTHAIKGATTILSNSASAALTVTQTGAGNAFVVEDSASTDSTPFVIDGAGKVLVGTTSSVTLSEGEVPFLQSNGTDSRWGLGLTRFSANAQGTGIYLGKSRGATVGTNAVVLSGDELGRITFCGDDSTDLYTIAALIRAEVDGTPGTNDMPGRLVFSTTDDGASSPTERMRIDSKGATTLLANSASAALTVTQTGAGNAFVVEDSASTDSTPFVVNASGTVGIGMTPPASAGVSSLFSLTDISMSGSSRGILGNLYYQAAWKFVDNGYGWSINDSSGAITFNLAGLNAGGAGVAATVTERMRIDSAGAVTIGGTLTANGQTVGYLNIPQNSQSAPYTLVLGDAGKHILHPSADTTARTITIPANSSVAFPIGTAVTFVNQASAGVMTIAITTDTMRLAGAGTTGSRTLAANGVATAIKLTSTEWIISGTNLT